MAGRVHKVKCELWRWIQTQTRRWFRLQLEKGTGPRSRPTYAQTMHKNTTHHSTTKVTRNNSDPVMLTRWTRNYYFLHRLADSTPPITTGTIYLCATTYKLHRLDFRTAVSELTFRFLCRAHLYVRQSTMPSCYWHIPSRLHCILLFAVASQKRRSSVEVMIVLGAIHCFSRTRRNSKNGAHTSLSGY